ncbi:hypothetical protein F5Y07DRAFT_134006 [Xylaria sp. FL0933]|nr:hypothetical protein F5Y07DRAFT_134006 [Xylaria sp. FL0933]
MATLRARRLPCSIISIYESVRQVGSNVPAAGCGSVPSRAHMEHLALVMYVCRRHPSPRGSSDVLALLKQSDTSIKSHSSLSPCMFLAEAYSWSKPIMADHEDCIAIHNRHLQMLAGRIMLRCWRSVERKFSRLGLFLPPNEVFCSTMSRETAARRSPGEGDISYCSINWGVRRGEYWRGHQLVEQVWQLSSWMQLCTMQLVDHCLLRWTKQSSGPFDTPQQPCFYLQLWTDWAACPPAWRSTATISAQLQQLHLVSAVWPVDCALWTEHGLSVD